MVTYRWITNTDFGCAFLHDIREYIWNECNCLLVSIDISDYNYSSVAFIFAYLTLVTLVCMWEYGVLLWINVCGNKADLFYPMCEWFLWFVSAWVFFFVRPGRINQHWKPRVVMMPTSSSLVAPMILRWGKRWYHGDSHFQWMSWTLTECNCTKSSNIV